MVWGHVEQELPVPYTSGQRHDVDPLLLCAGAVLTVHQCVQCEAPPAAGAAAVELVWLLPPSSREEHPKQHLSTRLANHALGHGCFMRTQRRAQTIGTGFTEEYFGLGRFIVFGRVRSPTFLRLNWCMILEPCIVGSTLGFAPNYLCQAGMVRATPFG